MTARAIAALIIVAFIASIIYQWVQRLPSDALSVAAGVLCGIAATLPISFALIIVLLRRSNSSPGAQGSTPVSNQVPTITRQSSQPQIIVVAPPQGAGTQGIPFNMPPFQNYAPHYSEDPEDIVDGRDWRIIGDES